MKVITFGTFDLLHIGHINIIKRARNFGDSLTVGVSSDALNIEKKGKFPIYSEYERSVLVSSLKYVDEVFIEESLEKKAEYIAQHKADVLVMGDDWQGKFDHLQQICKVVYLPRTPSISTTAIVEIVRNAKVS